jgi:putative cardiolipin synthase
MMRLFLIITALAGLFALASFLATYSFGHFARRAKGKPSSALPVADGDTLIDRASAQFVAGRDAESGLALIADNLDAFAARALAARSAGRSLDLMYYIWKNDLTGQLLSYEVLQAADRGVRVRLLVDDINTRGLDATYLALDSHPNISVRLFNPSRARQGGLRRGIEMALRAFSVTRRMHNKAWIADGRLAVIGGRNIGNEYFAAARTSNFRDLDVLLLGAGVRQTEAIFDAFWNSDVVIPIGALVTWRQPNLRRLRRNLAKLANGALAKPYIARVHERMSLSDMLDLTDKLHWSSEAKVISDPPEKAVGGKPENWLMAELTPVIAASKHALEIISPYFIPGDEGTARLTGMVSRGVDVAILTNSLAATDVAAVHGAYAHYREALLKGGVRLYELQPYTQRREISVFGSSGASLHTKAFTIDRQCGFIGSFNFDPRSASLNTEMGVLFEQPALAAEMHRLFELDTAPQASYGLSLKDGALRWNSLHDSQAQQFDRDPEASLPRRLLAFTVGLLPIQSQL